MVLLVSSSQAADFSLSIRQDSDTLIHVPDGLVQNFSIIVALHGMGSNYPDVFQHEISLDELGDGTGEFVTIYPLGSKCIGTTELCGHTWNGGQCCFSYEDDESYLIQAINESIVYLDQLEYGGSESAPIFIVGFSAGAVMAHRIACTHSNLVSGIAAVSGTINYPDCSPERPVKVLNFHGTLDPLFPWYGALFTSVPHTVEAWRLHNDCDMDEEPVESSLGFGLIEHMWTNCSQPIGLVTIEGGLHSWPPQRMNPEEYMWLHLKESML